MSDWRAFDLQIIPNSPLHLGDESGAGNFSQTRDVIPGANLRGAVAERALRECTQPEHKQDHAQCPDREQCPFWRIFGDREPLFGYAYPGTSGPAYPFPLTARTCKLARGFKASDKEGPHGIYDLLIDQFVYGLVSDPRYPSRDILQPGLGQQWAKLKEPLRDTCPECGSALALAQGSYVQPEGQSPHDAGSMSVRRATHVGINRARAVAEDSLLFTLETIEPAEEAIYFHSRVVAAEDCAATLRGYLKGVHAIGGGYSRGLGQVTCSISREQTEANGLKSRLDQFQQTVRTALAQYQIQDTRIKAEWPGTLFSVTLVSPAILESYGCVQTRLTPGWLGLPEAQLLQAWARTEVITGWDSAAGLPRRTSLGIQTGSAFLYWVPPQIESARLLELVEKIEVEGVGEQRPRGYGQALVCAPIHLHNRLGSAWTGRSQK